MVTTLELLAKNCMNTWGLEYIRNYHTLKFYVERLPVSLLLEEIGKVTDLEIFRILLAVGVSYEIQQAIVKRMGELGWEGSF